MVYNFKELKKGGAKTLEWLKKELQNIQTGRATVGFIDSVMIDLYGAKIPLKQVAGITLEDPRTLRVSPWDAGQIAAIEKGLLNANLGVLVNADGKGIRIAFPELTSERREEYVRLVSRKSEEAKISLRKERDNVWQDIQEQERNGDMSEDEKFRSKDEMEKIVKETESEIQKLAEIKEKEIRSL
jgi:ribosome recycling factor